MFPDPEGVALPGAAELKTDAARPGFDPFKVVRSEGAFSGGVGPGY
jgi:hypothetical protein